VEGFDSSVAVRNTRNEGPTTRAKENDAYIDRFLGRHVRPELQEREFVWGWWLHGHLIVPFNSLAWATEIPARADRKPKRSSSSSGAAHVFGTAALVQVRNSEVTRARQRSMRLP